MAMILDFFVSRYIKDITDFVEGEICKVLGVKKEIKTLQGRLETIRGFLQDAERKRRDSAVIDNWVRKLKDIMYEADDIIDLCMIEGGELLEARPSASAVSFPFSFVCSCFQCTRNRHEIAGRIEALNNTLIEMAADNSILPKLEVTSQEHRTHKVISRETSHLELEADIVGAQIETASEHLISSILENDKQKCRVFGIVGMGGIGKSTLARKIYNDERIKENFPIRKWLYISKNYSETDLLKELIRCAGEKCEGGETKAETFEGKSRAELEPKLASLLTKNFFLVLDDIWSPNVWKDLLRKPIIKGAASSTILVTTRLENVAKNLKPIHTHQVEKMDEDSGWKLLRGIVFEAGEEDDIRGLEEIGIKIVEKCDGLPLSIKAIGGVLNSKERSKAEWEKVLDSDVWGMNQIDEEVPRALYLSFEDLPSNLKQCFLYCSLYPEKGDMYYKEIVRFWVAEGLIEQGEQGKGLMEDLAEEYYRELVLRNLLQVDPTYVDKSYFSMHDHLRSLGKNLMQEEGISIRHGEKSDIKTNTKIRRLSVSNMGNRLVLPNLIMEQKCLRTLILIDSPRTKTIEDNVLRSLPHLRVLDLTNTSIERIPNSIGDLLHLRYLDLDSTNIHEIPESIGRLAYLQTLNISQCEYLHRLPKTITRLHNLRCLDIEGTPLTHVPKGIGKLKNFNNLQGFIVGHDDPTNELDEGCDLEELQPLAKLRGLSIYRLERAVTGALALAEKAFLRELTLSWMPPDADEDDDDDGDEEEEEEEEEDGDESNGDNDDDNNDNDDDGEEEEEDDNDGSQEDKGATWSEEQIQGAEKICDELSPPSSLQDLTMEQFPGRQFPRWMMSTSLGESCPNLAYLKLSVFPSCTELPPLGVLPQLKFLSIDGPNAVKTIGREFVGPLTPAFPKLETLQLWNMPNWEEWSLCGAEEVGHATHLKLLPQLKELFLYGCPKLRALPEGLSHATNLKDLYLERTHELTEVTNIPLAYKLDVTENKMLSRISNLSAIKYLEIDDCPSVEYVENLDKLHHLVLTCPRQMKSLPQWLSGLIEQRQSTPSALWSFRKFELQCNLALLKSCLKGNANWHIIQQIPDVKIQTYSGKAYILYTKDPHMYDTNVRPE